MYFVEKLTLSWTLPSLPIPPVAALFVTWSRQICRRRLHLTTVHYFLHRWMVYIVLCIVARRSGHALNQTLCTAVCRHCSSNVSLQIQLSTCLSLVFLLTSLCFEYVKKKEIEACRVDSPSSALCKNLSSLHYPASNICSVLFLTGPSGTRLREQNTTGSD